MRGRSMSAASTNAIYINPTDHVGLSFWLITGVMWAASGFFFLQVFLVPRQWATPMICAGIVTVVAWHHYCYMLETWADTNAAPTVFRYMDWFITVPIQVSQFHLILVASTPANKGKISQGIFFRLMFSALVMLVFGYMGETHTMDKWTAWICGFLCWIYIVFEITVGEAAMLSTKLSVDDAQLFLEKLGIAMDEENEAEGVQLNKKQRTAKLMKKAVNTALAPEKRSAGQVTAVDIARSEFKKPASVIAFEIIRIIFIFGWALYPAGFIIGHLTTPDGATTSSEENLLNAVYNMADVINKVAYGLAIYYAAGAELELQMFREADRRDRADSDALDRLLAKEHAEKVGSSIAGGMFAAPSPSGPQAGDRFAGVVGQVMSNPKFGLMTPMGLQIGGMPVADYDAPSRQGSASRPRTPMQSSPNVMGHSPEAAAYEAYLNPQMMPNFGEDGEDMERQTSALQGSSPAPRRNSTSIKMGNGQEIMIGGEGGDDAKGVEIVMKNKKGKKGDAQTIQIR